MFLRIFDSLGRIILYNIKMQGIEQNAHRNISARIVNSPLLLSMSSEQKDVIQLSSKQPCVLFSDSSVWMFQEYPLKEQPLDGYLGIVAVNVCRDLL